VRLGVQPFFVCFLSCYEPYEGRGPAPTEDFDGNESGMALRAEVTRKVGEHAVKQFVGVGWLDLWIIGRLPEKFARLVELCAAGAVV